LPSNPAIACDACGLPSPPPPDSPQRRHRQRHFFMILQTFSGGCVQIIYTRLHSLKTSSSN
jgi:hypothetical protein